ncbi:hypothetical protein HK405_011656 [Cladochytrium tenue]|nr:hypothetical protein HK405_011656 [Cladochytrium tenue]
MSISVFPPFNASSAVGDTIINGTSAYTLTYHIVEAAPAERRNSSLQARDLCGYVYDTWTDTQVVETGTWWNSWTRDTDCFSCSSSGGCSISRTWESSTSFTVSANFDTSTEGTVLDIIDGSAGLNLGFSWTTENSQSNTLSCNMNNGESGAIWTQQEMGWSNSQTRSCWYQYQSCIETSGCGSWSAYQHGDWPLSGSTTINAGCSVGSICYACNEQC